MRIHLKDTDLFTTAASFAIGSDQSRARYVYPHQGEVLRPLALQELNHLIACPYTYAQDTVPFLKVYLFHASLLEAAVRGYLGYRGVIDWG